MITTRTTLTIGGALTGLALLAATVGPLSAQESTSTEGTPTPDHAAMMQAATAEAGEAQTTAKMEEMMEQCLAMMKMMNMMMGMMGGGDMSGMMGGQDMQGMEDMPGMVATPQP